MSNSLIPARICKSVLKDDIVACTKSSTERESWQCSIAYHLIDLQVNNNTHTKLSTMKSNPSFQKILNNKALYAKMLKCAIRIPDVESSKLCLRCPGGRPADWYGWSRELRVQVLRCRVCNDRSVDALCWNTRDISYPRCYGVDIRLDVDHSQNSVVSPCRSDSSRVRRMGCYSTYKLKA